MIRKLPDFRKARVLVIGDVMLDQYIMGSAHRISPEAPVPVVHVTNNYYQPGGAGNVAANLSTLGCETTLVGLVGKDHHATTLRKVMEQYMIDGILFETAFPTITKVRVISHAQQLLRMDYEEPMMMGKKEEKKIADSVLQLIPFHHAIILSDYAKGVLSEGMCKKIIGAAHKFGIPVITDPKGSNWDKYAGSHIITPNFSEFKAMLSAPVKNEDREIAKAAGKLMDTCGAHYLLITRSEKGMSLAKPGKTEHWQTKAREVYDVSGAGDTVIATLSASIACGLPIEDAVELANIAAGVAVSKFGTATVTPEEIKEFIAR